MYSRTEEEKSNDIMVYERKAKAAAITKKYEKTDKKAKFIMLICAVLSLAVAAPFFYKAYDSESIVLMAIIAATVIACIIASRLIGGAVISRSLATYIKWGTLSAKWTAARKDMHTYEASFAEGTVFEPELKRAEKVLMDASDALIEFAKAKGIEYEI